MAANKTEIPAFMKNKISDQIYFMYSYVKKAYDNGKFAQTIDWPS